MLLSMAVMERPSWTDERLDERFNRVDTDIRDLRMEMREGFERIDKRFDQLDERFDRIDERFEKVDEKFERVDDRFYNLQRNMMTWFISGMVVVLVGIATT